MSRRVVVVLKDEIRRIARREVRGATAALRKASAQNLHAIAGLRRELKALHHRVAQLARQDLGRAEAQAGEAPEPQLRFYAAGVRSLRKRLGLSAEQLARLVGCSDQSVYNWERRKVRPRRAQLVALAALRSVGKREVQARLKQLAEQPPERRAKA